MVYCIPAQHVEKFIAVAEIFKEDGTVIENVTTSVWDTRRIVVKCASVSVESYLQGYAECLWNFFR